MAARRPSCIQLGAASEVSEGLGEGGPQGHRGHAHFTEVEVEAQREEPLSGSVRTCLGGILAPQSSTLCTCPLLRHWPPREGLLQPFWKILYYLMTSEQNRMMLGDPSTLTSTAQYREQDAATVKREFPGNRIFQEGKEAF